MSSLLLLCIILWNLLPLSLAPVCAQSDSFSEELPLQVPQVIPRSCQLIIPLDQIVQMAAHLAKFGQEALLGKFSLKFAFTLARLADDDVGRSCFGLLCKFGQKRALEIEMIDLVERHPVCVVCFCCNSWLWVWLDCLLIFLFVCNIRCVFNQVLLRLQHCLVLNPQELKDGLFRVLQFQRLRDLAPSIDSLLQDQFE